MALVIIKHREGSGVFDLPYVPRAGDKQVGVPDGSLLWIINGAPGWLEGNFYNVTDAERTHSRHGEAWTVTLVDIVPEEEMAE